MAYYISRQRTYASIHPSAFAKYSPYVVSVKQQVLNINHTTENRQQTMLMYVCLHMWAQCAPVIYLFN